MAKLQLTLEIEYDSTRIDGMLEGSTKSDSDYWSEAVQNALQEKLLPGPLNYRGLHKIQVYPHLDEY